jgi:hypothetical protein
MEQRPEVTAEVVRTWDRPLVMIPLFLLIAAIGGLFGSFTLSANLLVLGVGGTFIWLGLAGKVGRRPVLRRVPPAAVSWLVPVVLLGLVELFTFSMHSIEDYPTLSLLADPILEVYVARFACYFGWLVGFWGLVRR